MLTSGMAAGCGAFELVGYFLGVVPTRRFSLSKVYPNLDKSNQIGHPGLILWLQMVTFYGYFWLQIGENNTRET